MNKNNIYTHFVPQEPLLINNRRNDDTLNNVPSSHSLEGSSHSLDSPSNEAIEEIQIKMYHQQKQQQFLKQKDKMPLNQQQYQQQLHIEQQLQQQMRGYQRQQLMLQQQQKAIQQQMQILINTFPNLVCNMNEVKDTGMNEDDLTGDIMNNYLFNNCQNMLKENFNSVLIHDDRQQNQLIMNNFKHPAQSINQQFIPSYNNNQAIFNEQPYDFNNNQQHSFNNQQHSFNTQQHSFNNQQHNINTQQKLPPQTIIPANPLLSQEIPAWLKVYSKAPEEFDHKLKWNMFKLQELEFYGGLLMRLFKEDLEKIVMKYEKYRTSLEISMTQKQLLAQNQKLEQQNLMKKHQYQQMLEQQFQHQMQLDASNQQFNPHSFQQNQPLMPTHSSANHKTNFYLPKIHPILKLRDNQRSQELSQAKLTNNKNLQMYTKNDLTSQQLWQHIQNNQEKDQIIKSQKNQNLNKNEHRINIQQSSHEKQPLTPHLNQSKLSSDSVFGSFSEQF